jgi:large subunit ribosomal protein L5|tara:strand:- start:139 stop:681 length:543 start_codon:yes stop_codon:yes gene_type:complete
MSRLRQHYKNNLTKELAETFEYTDASQLPMVDKIIVNCGLKSINFNDKLIHPVLLALKGLTGQRPKITRSSKDNANLKIRSGAISGVKVTLRGTKMFMFLDQLILTILPRVDYLEGFSTRQLSKEGHFSLRIHDPLDSLFLETEFEKFQTLGPIDITIVTKNSSYEESLLLLTGLQVPII